MKYFGHTLLIGKFMKGWLVHEKLEWAFADMQMFDILTAKHVLSILETIDLGLADIEMSVKWYCISAFTNQDKFDGLIVYFNLILLTLVCDWPLMSRKLSNLES